MIELNCKTLFAAAKSFQKARQEKPWVTRIRGKKRSYRVVAKQAGHGKYMVNFYVLLGVRFGECNCDAGLREKFCYHLAAAYNRHLKNARKEYDQQRIAA